MKKYGKVALGVHFSVSAASITGLYVAIKNNVDVESILEKLPFGGVASGEDAKQSEHVEAPSSSVPENDVKDVVVVEKQRNRTAELVASSGGALALAVLCNKALFPVRVPITFALTPPVARFLARRGMIKTSV